MGRAGTARPVATGTKLLKHIQLLATHNADLGEISDAAVYVKGNVIDWVGPAADLPADRQTADLVLDMKHRVVMPGMVNTHHHMYQTLTRCIAQEELLFGWLTALYGGWEQLKGEDVYTACKTAMAELIMSGCTTTADHLYIYPNDVMCADSPRLDDSIRAAREIGIRFHPTRGAMTLGQSKGGQPPDAVCEEEDAVLKDMARVIAEFHDNSRYSMLRMSLAPCASFTVTDELMVEAAAMARQHPGVRLHTHLAENQEDINACQKIYGCRPGEYLKRVGWDKDDCWFAHCCMLNGAERKMFAENGLGIAHCPSANLRLGSGIAKVRPALDDGVNVGLGVDGSASNDAGNLLQEARLACFLQRAGGDVAAMTARDALHVAVQGGCKNLGRDDIGQIAPGFAADIVAFPTNKLAFAGAQHDVVAAVVFCSPGADQVDLSIINGEVVVRDGKLLTLDVEALIVEHNAVSQRICTYILPAKA